MGQFYWCLCGKGIISLTHFKYIFWEALRETTDKCNPILEGTEKQLCHRPGYIGLGQIKLTHAHDSDKYKINPKHTNTKD